MAKSSSPAKASPAKSPKGKGKAAAPPSPASVPLPPSSPAQAEAAPGSDNQLLNLADAITARAHLLAPGQSDPELLLQAQEALKAAFDRALSSESIAFPHLSTLLEDSSPAAGPSTRSQSRAPPESTPAPKTLALTPLEEITTDGMDPEMIWEQMEMRGTVVTELLEEMFGTGDGDEDDDEGEDGDEDEDDEDGIEFGDEESEEEEMSGEDDDDDEEEDEDAEPHYEELGPEGVHFGESDEEEQEEEEEAVDPMADETRDLTLDSFDRPGSGPSAKRQRRAPGPASSVDDQFFSLHDFHVQTDEGEFEMDKLMRGEDDDDDGAGEDDFDLFAAVDDDDEDAEENLDGAEPMYKDFFDPPPRELDTKGKPKKKGKGKPRYDRDEVAAEAGVPAAAAEKPASAKDGKDGKKKRSVKFNDAVKVKTIPKRGSEFDKLVAKVGWDKADAMLNAREKAAQAEAAEEEESEEGEQELMGEPVDEEDDESPEEIDYEDEEGEGEEDDEEEEDDGMEVDGEEEEEEEEGSGEDESDDDEGQETIERLKTSLFDDEDEQDESPQAKLSRHERRLVQLSSQIAALEAENVGPKDWATKGEAKARDRPTNSLLDEDLEYERMGKVVPVVTEETTKTIEDLIRRRILDNQFDDVVRQRPVDPNAFLPSRFMELQDSKSNKSLAEIYEDDYQTEKAKEEGRKVTNELDADLEKKHQEIEDLFEDLASKLDALSNARFTPKPPKATIQTVSNVASVNLESALPTTKSTSTLLAPEEVYVPDVTNEDRSNFTPAQKKAARQKRRKARAEMAQQAEKFSKGVKGDKERAVKQLVGTKGVTVIGKGGKAETGGKKRKRGEDDEVVHSGVGLKL